MFCDGRSSSAGSLSTFNIIHIVSSYLICKFPNVLVHFAFCSIINSCANEIKLLRRVDKIKFCFLPFIKMIVGTIKSFNWLIHHKQANILSGHVEMRKQVNMAMLRIRRF